MTGKKKIQLKRKKTWYYCKHIVCSKRYSSRASRHAHSKKCNKLLGSPLKKAKQVSGGFKCRYCSCKYKLQSSIYRHQKSSCNAARALSGKQSIKKAQKKEPLRFVCDMCNHRFDHKGKLDIHKANRHKTVPSYECNKCGRPFLRSDHYKKHKDKCQGMFTPSFTASDNCTDEQNDINQGDFTPSFISDTAPGSNSHLCELAPPADDSMNCNIDFSRNSELSLVELVDDWPIRLEHLKYHLASPFHLIHHVHLVHHDHLVFQQDLEYHSALVVHVHLLHQLYQQVVALQEDLEYQRLHATI